MPRILRAISRLLPEPVKRPIRASYGRLFSPQPEVTLQIGRYGGFEVAYRDHTADVDVLGHSFDKDIFFTGVPEYQPAEHHVIMDVGSHIGTFALLASSKVPAGKVYAVEACRESYNLCRINVALNNITNIDVAHLAIADRRGACKLHYSMGNWGHSIVAPVSRRGETVETDTLGGYMESRQITRCHFLKMNCEGAEFPIILAASPQVLCRIDLMLVLYHCDLYTGATEEVLLSHLRESGFDTAVRQRTAERGWIIAKR